MTTIRDIGVPRVEGETRDSGQQKLDKARTGRRFVVALGISALVLTVGNFVASSYLLRTVKDLRALDARLQDMAGMEKRIRASLDVLNTGFQTKLDDLGREVHDQIIELEDGVGKLHQRLDQQTSTAAAFPEPAIEPEASPATLPPAEPASDEAKASAPAGKDDAAADDTPVAAVEAPKPRKPKPAPVSRVGSAYQRIETPDGKVYYRRIH
jgi:hypothetical protein